MTSAHTGQAESRRIMKTQCINNSNTGGFRLSDFLETYGLSDIRKSQIFGRLSCRCYIPDIFLVQEHLFLPFK